MSFAEYFPVFDKLTESEREELLRVAVLRRVPRNTLIHSGGADCLGLLLVRSGQLRAFLTSDAGREITLYRLFSRDICLLSASCVMNSIQFDISISAEKDTELWIIPPGHYKKLMDSSLPVARYTNEIMATRFTEVMWLIEQVMWKSFDRRLAHFLLEESAIEGSDRLRLTHEAIAAHMGSAREVVTRMLKYFQTEGMVALGRGSVELMDRKKLESLDSE